MFDSVCHLLINNTIHKSLLGDFQLFSFRFASAKSKRCIQDPTAKSKRCEQDSTQPRDNSVGLASNFGDAGIAFGSLWNDFVRIQFDLILGSEEAAQFLFLFEVLPLQILFDVSQVFGHFLEDRLVIFLVEFTTSTCTFRLDQKLTKFGQIGLCLFVIAQFKLGYSTTVQRFRIGSFQLDDLVTERNDLGKLFCLEFAKSRIQKVNNQQLLFLVLFFLPEFFHPIALQCQQTFVILTESGVRSAFIE